MKAVAVSAIVGKAENDIDILISLLKMAGGLQTPSGSVVEAVLAQQIGICTYVKRGWEAKAEELDYPTGASA
jgi:hypothetical protein